LAVGTRPGEWAKSCFTVQARITCIEQGWQEFRSRMLKKYGPVVLPGGISPFDSGARGRTAASSCWCFDDGKISHDVGGPVLLSERDGRTVPPEVLSKNFGRQPTVVSMAFPKQELFNFSRLTFPDHWKPTRKGRRPRRSRRSLRSDFAFSDDGKWEPTKATRGGRCAPSVDSGNFKDLNNGRWGNRHGSPGGDGGNLHWQPQTGRRVAIPFITGKGRMTVVGDG